MLKLDCITAFNFSHLDGRVAYKQTKILIVDCILTPLPPTTYTYKIIFRWKGSIQTNKHINSVLHFNHPPPTPYIYKIIFRWKGSIQTYQHINSVLHLTPPLTPYTNKIIFRWKGSIQTHQHINSVLHFTPPLPHTYAK